MQEIFTNATIADISGRVEGRIESPLLFTY